ncbi:MAG: C1 family peptidase [Ancrocorticia sp.]
MATAVLDPSFGVEQARNFRRDSVARIVQNAVSAQGADAISLDREAVNRIDESTSERLDAWKATDQKHSGRCWEFAGLNILRAKIIAELKLDDFEFSQNFIAFYDKLEKANHLLVRAIETCDDSLDSEDVRDLLDSAAPDGGYWAQFVDLVRKYGVVPVWAMPDTQPAGNTLELNRALSTVLRRAIGRIRRAATESEAAAESQAGTESEAAAEPQAVTEPQAGPAREDILDAIRARTIADVWRILAIHLGTPPEQFTWQYRDKEKNFHAEGAMTPREFATKYVPANLDSYVGLTHDPRKENPLGRNYVIDHTPFMEGGTPYTHVSAPIEDLKSAAIAAIRDGEPVWFSCDVKKQFDKDQGIWDATLHDYGVLYGVDLDISKADRMRLRETAPTHAMTLVGVDLVDGQPRRWRVENSWGDKVGRKGFFTMDDSWFDEYVFQVIVAPERLSGEQRAAAQEQPIILPNWDALA